MLASSIMQKPVVIHNDAHVKYALDKMRETGHRLLPVVDKENHIAGLFSMQSVIAHLVPDYIVSGDLDDIPYAPDFGLLRKHYDAVKGLQVSELMGEKAFVVKPEESLLSVAAALVTHAISDCVLVTDSTDVLVGIITPTDVLERLRSMHTDEAHVD